MPLIIRAPWLTGGAGTRSSALVELVDILPTAAALAGVSLPPAETFDGVSLVPLLNGSDSGGGGDSGGGSEWWAPKPAAFSQYPRRVKDATRPWYDNSIIHHDRTMFTHMGYTSRTHEWRYTEWVEWNQTSLRPVWARVEARELYDHRGEAAYPTDFDVGETENVADRAEYASEVATLAKLLRSQFGS